MEIVIKRCPSILFKNANVFITSKPWQISIWHSDYLAGALREVYYGRAPLCRAPAHGKPQYTHGKRFVVRFSSRRTAKPARQQFARQRGFAVRFLSRARRTSLSCVKVNSRQKKSPPGLPQMAAALTVVRLAARGSVCRAPCVFFLAHGKDQSLTCVFC
jgi:hypothetical protein